MILSILLLIIKIIEVLIIIRIILSWVSSSRNEFTDLIYSVTEPLLAPFRFKIPLGNAYLDIAPIVLFFVLNLIKKLIFTLF